MSEAEGHDEEFGPQPTFGKSLYFSHTNLGEPGDVTQGRPRKFQSAAQLEKACHEYFDWIEQNPLMEHVFQSGGKDGQFKTTMPRMRAMTLEGLTLFLEIGSTCWRDYAGGARNTPAQDGQPAQDYSAVCSRVMFAIRNQKFEGAAGGFLNPSIIARDLGLADKKEFSGPGGGPIKTDGTVSVKDAAAQYEDSLREGEDS